MQTKLGYACTHEDLIAVYYYLHGYFVLSWFFCEDGKIGKLLDALTASTVEFLLLTSMICSVQEFETREQQVKETEEYVVQERARLNDFESALKLREETLEEQKIELVSFFTSMIKTCFAIPCKSHS